MLTVKLFQQNPSVVDLGGCSLAWL